MYSFLLKVARDERRIRFEVCNNAFTKVRLLLNSFFFEGISEPEKHYSLLLAKINYKTLLFYISGIICCHYNEECVKNKKLKKKKMRTSVSLISYYAYCWVPKPGIL